MKEKKWERENLIFYYRHKKEMFLRWNWFLCLVILAFISSIITILIKIGGIMISIYATIFFSLCIIILIIFTLKSKKELEMIVKKLIPIQKL